MVHIVVPPMGLETTSASWVPSLAPPLGTLCSVQWLAQSIYLCICQALADSRCWRGCRERRTLYNCWWDCKLIQPLWKSFWQFLRKLDIVLPEDPTIPLLGIYPEYALTCNKDTCSTMIIAALFIIAECWKEPRCPLTEEWIQKFGTITQWITTQLLTMMNL